MTIVDMYFNKRLLYNCFNQYSDYMSHVLCLLQRHSTAQFLNVWLIINE